MKIYEWDELLEQGELLDMTREALEPLRRRKGWTWKRAGAIAACAAVVLCVTNFSALAAGVERMVQYFAGLGAVEEQVGLLVLEEPLEWTEGDWNYSLWAVQTGEYVNIEMEVYSSEEYPDTAELSFPAEIEPGKAFHAGGFRWQFTEAPSGKDYYHPVVYNVQLMADGIPQKRGALEVDQWVDEEYNERVYGAKDITANDQAIGYVYSMKENPGSTTGNRRYEGRIQVMFKADAQPEDGYTLCISDWDEKSLWEFQLSLESPAALEYIEDTRKFPQGELSALVSQDGRRLSFYADRTLAVNTTEGNLWNVPSAEVWFVGASGTRYRALPSENRAAAAYMLVEYIAPADMEEPAVSVEIQELTLETMLVHKILSDSGEELRTQGYARDYFYGNLDWTIELP